MSSFPYKTDPFEHQREALRRSSHRKYFGLLMEQGTGKSKVVVDTAGYLRLEDKIDAVIILAPSIVHIEWIRDQFPTHMTEAVKWKGFIWRSSKANTKSYQEAFREWNETRGALLVFSMNIEAVMTNGGKTALRSLIKERRCLVCVDESTDIKSPGAKRTITLRHLAPHMAYRRILSGLPDPEGPLDLYSQLRFLSPDIVGSSYTSFKNEYAIFEQAPWNVKVPILRGYKNLDRLTAKMAEHTFQITKDEAGLNLPEKLYTKRYYELTKEQARMYAELESNYITSFPGILDDDFSEDGVVTAEMAIVRWLRLHQITCGYVPTDLSGPEEPERRIPGSNPRLDALLQILETTVGPVIVWCRFSPDIDLILDAISENPHLGKAVRYDGHVKQADKLKNKDLYTSGEARIFVGNPKAGGRGLTLVNTKTMVFYSQYFGLEPRLQGEDRAHRIGLRHPVLYIDLIAEGTVDEKILKRLREKRTLAEMVINRKGGEWI